MKTIDFNEERRKNRAGAALACAAVAMLLSACGSGGGPDPTISDDPPGYEAEQAAPQETFTTGTDPEASNGTYLEQRETAPPATSGEEVASLPITIDEAGEHSLWVRLRAENGDSDAVYLGFNGDMQRVYPESYEEYTWVLVDRRALSAGEHRISLGPGEPKLRIDLFAVLTDETVDAADLEERYLGADAQEPAPSEEPEAPTDEQPEPPADEEEPEDAPAPDAEVPQQFPLHEAPSSLPWSHVGEWTFENDSYDGNPFDLEASAVFTHEESGDTARTGMFYAGDDRWGVRFPATRLGAWSFETRSDDDDLDGLTGTVKVTAGPEEGKGFLRARGDKLVTAVDDGATDLAVPYNVYMTDENAFFHLGDLPDDRDDRMERIDELLDEVEEFGFRSLFVGMYHNWFDFGAFSEDDHDRDDPDPDTFEALEDVILRAHERGMFVHLWAWGDESRGLTAEGVGGINGEADRRLQRYIAARLGPVPGWTMSYGFDLEEWVKPDEIGEWGEHMQEHTSWPLILAARELGDHRGDVLELDEDRLEIYSTDDQPTDDFYDLALDRLDEGRPVLFERRFLHGRDGVWDSDTTLEALWQFTMAGGAGAIWGMPFHDPEPYDDPERFRIHGRFWAERFLPTMQPMDDVAEGYGLRSDAGDRFVFYVSDDDELELALEGLDRPRRAVAVDAHGDDYEEIELGELEPGSRTWEAPHASDWVIAVGFD